jgi:hypothetical protein
MFPGSRGGGGSRFLGEPATTPDYSMPKEVSSLETAAGVGKVDPFDTIKEITKVKRPMSSN